MLVSTSKDGHFKAWAAAPDAHAANADAPDHTEGEKVFPHTQLLLLGVFIPRIPQQKRHTWKKTRSYILGIGQLTLSARY